MTWAEGFTREKQALFEELLLDWEDAPYNQEKALESFLEHVRAFLDPSDGKQLQISRERSKKREEGKSD